MNLKAIILAGGYSTRFGQDKSLFKVNGETLVERAIQALRPHIEEIHLAVRKEQVNNFTDLVPRSIIILEDNLRDIGPGAALFKAFQVDPLAHWLVLACDFVYVNHEAIEALLQEASIHTGYDIVCYQNSEAYSEPLFAIWSPQALAELRDNIDKTIYGPMACLKSLKCLNVKLNDERVLFNLNSPVTEKDLIFSMPKTSSTLA